MSCEADAKATNMANAARSAMSVRGEQKAIAAMPGDDRELRHQQPAAAPPEEAAARSGPSPAPTGT
jgi:hypothetical protein